MLEEIRISNFAIIEHLELDFDKGFNVITGETGAGKSIVIDAVELLVGGKADSEMVRNGADKAVVEGVFSLNQNTHARIHPLLESEGLLDDGDNHYITLTREIRINGRTSARINGVTVSSDVLREIGEHLVDIHGQSSHMSLFKPRAHIDLLDRYADLLEVRDALATVNKTLDGIRAEMRVLTEGKEALERRIDRLRYAVEEISVAELREGEENELTAERNRLANSEQLAKFSAEIHVLLSGDEREDAKPAVDQLMHITNLLMKLIRIDPSLTDAYNLAQDISENAQELAIRIANYADDIEYNPNRLDEIEERLELIKSLKRRYNCDSITDLNAYAQRSAEELSNIENSSERLEQLRAQEDKTLRHIGELSERISGVRAIAGRNLGKRIVRELKDLRMENTRFEVQMVRIEDPNGCYGRDGKRYAFDSTGIDKLEFVMSANPGEPLRPLAKVASGGEAARIMLSLKRVLTQADQTPTLIFDEIDQGIGGRIGSVVGEKLWMLTQGHQVMCVTHLPQLAGFGDKHYKVQKTVQSNRTATEISPLNEEIQQVEELAQMLGTPSDSGRDSARDILLAARHRKHELTHGKDEQQPLL